MFFKIGILKNFANFRGKYLSWSLFSIVAGPQACNFIKKRLQDRCFILVKFAKFLRTPYLTEHLQWLLLKQIDLISKPLALFLQEIIPFRIKYNTVESVTYK